MRKSVVDKRGKQTLMEANLRKRGESFVSCHHQHHPEFIFWGIEKLIVSVSGQFHHIISAEQSNSNAKNIVNQLSSQLLTCVNFNSDVW
jgi:hypothetical protein